MTGETQLEGWIEEARASPAFVEYQRVRGAVLRMLDDPRAKAANASNYWREELGGFHYLFDASPLVIARLREHCHHLTGIRSYDYRAHHRVGREGALAKLARLKGLDGGRHFGGEPPLLGGFGFETPEGLVNLDTLKFYEVLIALNRAGALEPFREPSGRRPMAVEIGGGWGGLAWQFKRLFPDCCYVIVDLPPVFLFSAVYLRTAFPAARTWLCGENAESFPADPAKYDFIFLPHYERPRLPAELAINVASFQEMTAAQVQGYVDWLADAGCPLLYSLNRERSPYNDEIRSVRELLKARYRVEELKLLELPYNLLPESEPEGLAERARELARSLWRRARPAPPLGYRHLVGTR